LRPEDADGCKAPTGAEIAGDQDLSDVPPERREPAERNAVGLALQVRDRSSTEAERDSSTAYANKTEDDRAVDGRGGEVNRPRRRFRGIVDRCIGRP
jgi:hypothetical protein